MAEEATPSRLQYSRQEKKDRISRLPDEVLCHILSFLPTKYAVRTCVLSSRWRCIWTSVPVLLFHENLVGSHGSGEYGRLFMNFVDRVLFFNNVQSIQTFYLRFSGNCDPFRLNAWICVAIMRNVVELHLDLYIFKGALQLPRSLFRCEKLKILKLCNGKLLEDSFILDVPDSVSLPSLKVLHLESLHCLCDASMKKLLSGTPVLEQLEIIRNGIDDMWNLYINSCSLKSLTIQNFGCYNEIFDHDNHRYKVVVNAPNLEFLELTDYMTEELNVTFSFSIVTALIDVNIEGISGKKFCDYANGVVRLLRQISNVKILCLSGFLLTILDGGEQGRLTTLHDNLVTFHNLIHLELKTACESFISLDILACTPNLEVLVLEIADDALWEPLKTVPECLLSCLKMDQIRGFSASELEMEILECLLKIAAVLEKMDMSCYFWLPVIDPDILKKLLTFPRASSSCQILFSQQKDFPSYCT